MNRQELAPIRAIAFDAYGTLFDVSSIDTALRELFGAEAARLAALWRQKQLEYTWLRTLMGRYKDFYALTEEALNYALRATHTEAAPAQVRSLMSAYYELQAFPDALEALPKLARQYQLVILSNANPSLLERACAFNRIDPYFRHLLSADEVQCYKPAPKVYALPAAHLSLQPSALLFVSSNTWDIAGATAAGLTCAWANRKNGHLEALGPEPSFVINDLTELL